MNAPQRITPAVIGKQKATELFASMLKYSEGHLLPPIADNVRSQVISRVMGIFKDFYLLPNGNYGHAGIETMFRAAAHQQAARSMRKQLTKE